MAKYASDHDCLWSKYDSLKNKYDLLEKKYGKLQKDYAKIVEELYTSRLESNARSYEDWLGGQL